MKSALLVLFCIGNLTTSLVASSEKDLPKSELFGLLSKKQVKLLQSLDPSQTKLLTLESVKFGIVFGYDSKLLHAIISSGFVAPENRETIEGLFSTDGDFSDTLHTIENHYPALQNGGSLPLNTQTDLPNPTALGISKTAFSVPIAQSVPSPSQWGTTQGFGPMAPRVSSNKDKLVHTFGLWQADKDLGVADDFIAQPETAPANAKPANFSFLDDFAGRQITYSAKGVAVADFAFPIASPEEREYHFPKPGSSKPVSNPPYIPFIQIIPDIGFDRTSIDNLGNSTGSKKAETNELDLKLGLQWQLARIYQFNDPQKSMYSEDFRVSFHQATDFDFRSKITGGEIDTQPIFATFGTSLPLNLGNFVQFRWAVVGHAEGGSIGNAGPYTSLQPYSDYGRLGGSAEIDLIPIAKYWNQLTLSDTYFYYKTVAGGSASAHGFDITLSYYLIPNNQNYSLTSEYRDEVQDLTLMKIKSVTFGLGLKF